MEHKVWIMNAINSAVRVCCTDLIHVQHRDTSFTHFLHGVSVEQFNSLKKGHLRRLVNIIVHLSDRCTYVYIENSRKTHLARFHDDLK